MADPAGYDVGYDFSAFQSGAPSLPLPGNKLDTELANIATAVDALVAGVKDVRRSDGALQNGVVTPDSLGAGLEWLADEAAIFGTLEAAEASASASAVTAAASAASAQTNAVTASTQAGLATDAAASATSDAATATTQAGIATTQAGIAVAAAGAVGNASVAGLTQHGVAIATAANAVGASIVLTDGQIVVGQTGAAPLAKAVSGDATLAASGAVAIAAKAVTYAKMQDVSATARILGRKTAGAGVVEELTGAEAISLMGLGTAATQASTAFQAADAALHSNLPQNSKSADYTTVLTDANGHIFHPDADLTARTFTIDSNANVAYPIGTTLTFVNGHGAGIITIAITADTMRLAGTGATGSRTLAANGMATAIKVAATEWKISGVGLT